MTKWLNQHLHSILYKDWNRRRNPLTSLNKLELRHHSKVPFLTLHRHAELVAHRRHLSNHVSRREKRKKLFAVQNGLRKLLNKPPRKQLGKRNLSASGSRKSSKRLNVWSENAKKPSQDEPKSNEARMSWMPSPRCLLLTWLMRKFKQRRTKRILGRKRVPGWSSKWRLTGLREKKPTGKSRGSSKKR